MKKNNVFNGIMVVLIIVIVGVTFALSYAYFTPIITGGDTSLEATTAKFDVNFETSSYINTTNSIRVPIKDADRADKAAHTDFTVSLNDSTISGKYNVYLTDITITDNWKNSAIKWELIKDNEYLNGGNFQDIGENNQIQLNPTAIDISTTDEHNYILRLWMSETTGNQNDLMNGSIKGRVKVVATNNKGTNTNNAEY